MKLFGESCCILWPESDNKRSLREEYAEIGCTARSIPAKISADTLAIISSREFTVVKAKLTALVAV